MPRLVGVNIPEEKKVKIALTYIYGIGRTNVSNIIKRANVDGEKRAKDLTDQEISRLLKTIDAVPTEGALRKIITDNIQRLKQIRCYRGSRHIQRLPVRGQRTRVNARTRRGRRMTVGALKKEDAQKLVDATQDKK